MARVKRGKSHLKRRNSLLKQAKGFLWGRKNLIKLASTAITKAGAHAYRHRRTRKIDFRGLWNNKISGALFESTLSYSRLIGGLKKEKISLNRKMLAELAEYNPEVFNKVTGQVKV